MPHKSAAILVVEDDDDDVLLIRRAFEKVGLRNPVIFLSDGDTAAAYLLGEGVFANRAEHPLPTLVLLDLKLPRLSGLEVLERARSRSDLNWISIVILTSSSHSTDITRAYERGATSYLVKPTDFDELVATVDLVKRYWIETNHKPRERGR